MLIGLMFVRGGLLMNNEKNIIQKAYEFNQLSDISYKVMDMIKEQLILSQSNNPKKTIDWIEPKQQLEYWQNEFASQKTDLLSLMKKISDHSINFHNRGYVGHQVAVTLPITVLTSALIAYLNNCTTVYELGMAGNAMEKVVIEHLAHKFGYKQGTGFVASGGSMGNLTALVTARTSLGIKEEDYHKLSIMVSSEAHYSVERAAKIMGIKSDNVIKIPVDDKLSIRVETLEDLYQKAIKEGKIVFCIVGCACTTSVGAYDDLNAIADFAEKHQIWFHVDGAHGGAVIFSEKYKYLIRGIEKSDSLIVDFHKMMLVPPLSTAVIYNSSNRKINEFSPKAAYLWQNQLSEEWWNSAKHTLECTKPLTIIHTYAIMRIYGDEIYQQNVDTLYDLSHEFAQMIRERENMELALDPISNIICFRYVTNHKNNDDLNRRIAKELLKDGTYYVVNTTVNGNFYLRVTLMNALTTIDDLEKLLDKIQEIALMQ